ncbi:MAG: Hpt domain-containing protein [Planctomycetes bacterium]|nr:Hpt domain-containing protein [Planctomycetota bacterium]
MEPSIEITPELLAGFIDEADEYLDTLSELLMQFEEEAAAGPISFVEGEKLDQMNEMFRAAHSLKGLSGAFGFAEMNSLNHRMETLFDEAKMGKRSLDSQALESLLTAQGVIQEQVEELKSPTGAQIDVTASMEQLQAILDSTDSAGGEAAPSISSAQAHTPAGEACEASPAQLTSTEQGVPASVLDDPELRAIFIQSTEEDVEELSQVLLKIEEAANEEITTEAFRIAHTIKGSCGAAGLTDAHDLTHRMETLLEQLRGGELTVSDPLMATLLAVTDRLREVVEQVKVNTYSAWPENRIEELFAAWGLSGPRPSDAAPQDAGATVSESGDDEFYLPDEILSGEKEALLVRVDFDTDNPESALQPFLIHNKLKDLGDVISSQPDMEKDTGEQPIATLKAVVAVEHATEESAEQLQVLLSSFEVTSATVKLARGRSSAQAAELPSESGGSVSEQVQPPKGQRPSTRLQGRAAVARTEKAGAPPRPAGTQKAPLVRETIRVDVDRLDQLMNLGGELIINRSQFLQRHLSARVKLISRQHRTPQQVGIDFQRLCQIVRQQRPAIAGVGDGDRLPSLDAQVFQRLNELPAVSRSGARGRTRDRATYLRCRSRNELRGRPGPPTRFRGRSPVPWTANPLA